MIFVNDIRFLYNLVIRLVNRLRMPYIDYEGNLNNTQPAAKPEKAGTMTIKHKDWTMVIVVKDNETGKNITESMLTDLRIALFSAEYDYRAKGYKFCADYYRDLREALAIPETEAESNG